MTGNQIYLPFSRVNLSSKLSYSLLLKRRGRFLPLCCSRLLSSHSRDPSRHNKDPSSSNIGHNLREISNRDQDQSLSSALLLSPKVPFSWRTISFEARFSNCRVELLSHQRRRYLSSHQLTSHFSILWGVKLIWRKSTNSKIKRI
jgi:hypothetical protein